MGEGARGCDRDGVTIVGTQEECNNLLYSHQIHLKEDQEKVQNVFFGKSHSIYSIILVYVKRENKMLLLNLNYDLYRENVMLSLHLY